MSNEFFFTKIKEEVTGNIWFQQDSATCYTAEVTLNVLRPVWPLWSCDLTSLDYYFWGVVKDKCYSDKPDAIDALKHNIREAIGEIQLHIIDNTLKNWTYRVCYCMASRGNHVNEINC